MKKLAAVALMVLPLFAEPPDDQRIAANEAAARSCLRNIVVAQAQFRMMDRDGNGAADYWVADVSGLARIKASKDSKDGIALIEPTLACADAKPCVPLDKEGEFKGGNEPVTLVAAGAAKPKIGYLFQTVAKYQDRDGKWEAYDPGNGRNAALYAFCALPAEYGKTGNNTFIISEIGTVWKKDTGGKEPEGMPFDPAKDGWTEAK